MKKYLFALVAILASVSIHAQTATSSYYRHMNESGLAKLRWTERVELSGQPDTWWKRASTGHIEGWKHETWEIGLSGGVSYLDNRVSPIAQITVRNDGVALWKRWKTIDALDDEGNCILTDDMIAEIEKKGGEIVRDSTGRVVAAGGRVPVRCWAVSADASAEPRWYLPGTASEEQQYWAIKARLNMEYRLIDTKNSVFQLYPFISGGFLLEHYDKLVASVPVEGGVWQSYAEHKAFGWTCGGGLRFVFNVPHSPVSFWVTGRAEAQALALLNHTPVKFGAEVTGGVAIRLLSHVK